MPPTKDADRRSADRRSKEIRDRKRITDHVADYMHDRCRSFSIDTLLCRPTDAMTMALAVGIKSGRLRKVDAVPLLKQLADWQEHHGEVLEVVDEICRAALSSRKRGDLKRDAH